MEHPYGGGRLGAISPKIPDRTGWEDQTYMRQILRTLWQDDAAQDTTEYVLLVALIALAVTAGMTILASNINDAFSAAGGELQTQTGSTP